jgi:serine/threonine-protein kinase RsbT
VEIAVVAEKDVPVAYETAVSLARTLGFSRADTTCVATVVTELARNILSYATTGKIILSGVIRADRAGIKITAVDSGPGISDLETILSGNYKSASGLGLGLLGAKNLLDDFQVDTAPGSGTTITGIKYGR